VSAADSERLAAVVADRNSPQKHVWRARIILATADGYGTAEIMRRAGVSKPCVWCWQERFTHEGVAGLLRDKTRKPGLPPLPPALVDLQAAINRYVGEHNRKPKPFLWTADPDRIIEKVKRGYQVMASDHPSVSLRKRFFTDN